MVLLEAAGLDLYLGMAAGTDNAAVRALLEHNGREEMAHAHRVAKSIRAISGEDYAPPESAVNPYLSGPIPAPPVTADTLRGLARANLAARAFMNGGRRTATMPKPRACSGSRAARNAITASGC